MDGSPTVNRRTALKTIGIGIASLAYVGTVSAGDTNPKNIHTYTWANDDLWDMLASEPRGTDDNEGADPAHRPIWLIESMADTGVPGSEHSPHPAPVIADHVIGLEPGKKFFSAQWHVHLVTDGPPDIPEDPEPPFEIPNLVNWVDGLGYLTNAADIRAAEKNEDVTVTPIEDVFTCPVRPHNHK